MCGIAAILLYPENRNPADWREIGDVFTQNLIFNEERGKAATGVAIIGINGQVRLYKRALTASKFVKTAEYQDVLSGLGKQTTLVLGHTRLPTKGESSVNRNNHPVQAGSVFGVHNGHVKNDDELFAQGGYSRTANVDSEIIFRLVESVDPTMKTKQYLDKIRHLIFGMQGQYTFLACDQRKPEQLMVLKHHNPLCVHFHPKWKALIFSSRYIFLRKAFGPTQVAETLEQDQLMLFDVNRIPEMGIQPVVAMSIHNSAKYER